MDNTSDSTEEKKVEDAKTETTEETVEASAEESKEASAEKSEKPKGKGKKQKRNPKPKKVVAKVEQTQRVGLTAKDKELLKAERPQVDMNLRGLLQAGVHYGHQTARWNPAMAQYIYTVRNGIHIINLPKTLEAWTGAQKIITDTAAGGGSILFVGTKKQAQDIVQQEAERCGSFYVSRRWLGGMLTNFSTVRKSIDRMKKLEGILDEENKNAEQGATSKYTKKERLMMQREKDKLEHSLGGIRDMVNYPKLIFVVDTKREHIAIKEAQRLDIPVVALVDTNSDPNEVAHPVPGNDDGARSILFFLQAASNAVLEGKDKLAERTRTAAAVISSNSKEASKSDSSEEELKTNSASEESTDKEVSQSEEAPMVVSELSAPSA